MLCGRARRYGGLRVSRCSRPAEAVGVAADAEPSLVGVTGRVTVSIPANGPGEVLLPVRGGTEVFAAWADEPISKHTHVMVIDCMSARSVIVTPCP